LASSSFLKTTATLQPKLVATLTPTPFLTSTAIEQNTPTPQVEIKCAELAAKGAMNLETGGSIVLGGDSFKSPTYLLDMSSMKTTALFQRSGDHLWEISISPDQHWLAYSIVTYNTIYYELFVRSADGKTQKVISWEPSWRQLAGWLDNENLILSVKRGSLEADSLLIFNPFTGQRKELLPDFMDEASSLSTQLNPNFSWAGFNHSFTVYNPSLNQVVYSKSGNGDDWGVALWDLNLHKQLALLPDDIGSEPKWSPDGKGFIINGTIKKGASEPNNYEELFYVDQFGKITQLTHLNNNSSVTSIGTFDWSPDGKKIAFTYFQDPSPKYPDIYPDANLGLHNRLAVLDWGTGKLTDTCLPDYPLTDPVWSPDSRYIVVQSIYDERSPYRSHVYLIDIVNEIAYRIAENGWPSGWLK
jgi:Tol biopolymer transport system component